MRDLLPALLCLVLATTLQGQTAATDSPDVPSDVAAKQQAADLPETREQKDARMKWWREARFGMFIHWGIYAVPAGTYEGKQIRGYGEWIQNTAKIPIARYARYADEFNPTKFDADAIVKLAKDAGQKYIIITAKHHDGFALFHSKASTFNVVDATPFKRDIIKELAEACQKQGIKLGLYYSHAQDWHHPGGSISGRPWDEAQKGDFDTYFDTVALPQIKEILSNYGPIAVIWWDTSAHMNAKRAETVKQLLALQPGIIANNRFGADVKGDTETPEGSIPANGYVDRDWETCMTINDTWGYKSYDTKYKSAVELLRNLIDIASKGGNYLLNVGPTAEGEIPEPFVERLQAIGAWLKINGEAIYGTTASPMKTPGWYRMTTRREEGKTTIYVHFFEWPKDRKFTVPFTHEITAATLLAAPSETLTREGAVIKLPEKMPDLNATVLKIELKGEIEKR